jgi:L-threonylcarbamoyladenylate synthase
LTLILNIEDVEQFEYARELLVDKKVPVALPTETVYGLAALADDEKALAQIFKLKARPHFDPLIVHVLSAENVTPWVLEQNEWHQKLMKRFWPGPLSLLFKKSSRIPDLCTAGSPWVALRSPSHPQFRKILQALDGRALAAPSANRFMSISPTTSQDVVSELGPYGLEAVVEGGACEKGLESTVLKIHDPQKLEIVRAGAISVEEIRECVGPDLEIILRSSGSGIEASRLNEAPGQHHIHYAPQKPLYLVPPKELTQFLASHSHLKAYALLEVFPSQLSSLTGSKIRHEILSLRSSWDEAAAKFFSTLRSLDQDPRVECIVALECAPESLGYAILDRLKRASQKTNVEEI